MADSNITKRALAAALRELMTELPFEKINVAQICEKCGMNRKSFYYHFKDKYDLVNWIFDTDFIPFARAFAEATRLNKRMELLQQVCNYFYENREFYSKALKIKGQNSFSDHLREYSRPFLKMRISALIGDEMGEDEFAVNFFTDAMLCAVERWITDRDCMPPDEFVSKLKLMILGGASALRQEMDQADSDS